MPQNVSLKKVLVFGASSLNENHISENDFAVAQACRVFHEKGLEVVLISPNPNSIITDKCRLVTMHKRKRTRLAIFKRLYSML